MPKKPRKKMKPTKQHKSPLKYTYKALDDASPNASKSNRNGSNLNNSNGLSSECWDELIVMVKARGY